jgi:hypothetical protein
VDAVLGVLGIAAESESTAEENESPSNPLILMLFGAKFALEHAARIPS